ncbi:MAG TPA: hypothetical protein DCP08_02135 [Chloroflexi bacterium]|nr:hypothetical protein [Chloroflexota bacterium]
MRAAIIYFSQTGNTERIAEAICLGLNSQHLPADLIPLSKAKPTDLARYDFLGLGHPVFFWKPPLNVRRFINSLPSLEGQRGFVFCTWGSHKSSALLVTAKMLSQRGLQILGTFDARGFDSYPIYNKMGLGFGHPDEKELEAARGFGADLARKVHDDETMRVALPRFIFHLLPILSPDWLTSSRLFPKARLTQDACDRCGECAEVCPTGNIEMTPYPLLGEDCLGCYRCAEVCPLGALHVNWRWYHLWWIAFPYGWFFSILDRWRLRSRQAVQTGR